MKLDDVARALSLFDIASDAVAANRGFNLQYLDTVEQWIKAWGSANQIFCEVMEDAVIVTPGSEQMEFRQIKSYHSKPLGFGDSEVRHTIYLFYRNALRYGTKSCTFVLFLDGSVRPRDIVMRHWVEFGVPSSWSEASSLLKGIVSEQLDNIRAHKIRLSSDSSQATAIEVDFARETERLRQFDFEELAQSVRIEVCRQPLESKLSGIVQRVEEMGISLLPAHLVVARAFQEVSLSSARATSYERVLTQERLRQIVAEDEALAHEKLRGDALGVRLLDEVRRRFDQVDATLESLNQTGRSVALALQDLGVLPAVLGFEGGLALEDVKANQWANANSQPDPGYYRGKKAEWRHILASQDVARPELVAEIFRHLAGPDRNCILYGESGQGKTTLMYRTAYNYRSLFTVLEVRNVDFTPKEKAELVARFLGELHGRVLLLIDDVTRRNGWQHLLEAVLRHPKVYVLATSRSDEWIGVGLQGLSGRLHRVRPELSEPTARGIFAGLADRGLVATGSTYSDAWIRSRRRLLEFVTIVTHGDHLEALLTAQLDNLSTQPRADLLRQTLRLIATAHMFGRSLSLDGIGQAIGAPEETTVEVLRFLKGEFIELDGNEGKYRGLHELRSQKLAELLHEVVPLRNTLRKLYEVLPPDERLDLAESIKKRLPEQLNSVRDLLLRDLGDLHNPLTGRRLGCVNDLLTKQERARLVQRLRHHITELRGRRGTLWLLSACEEAPRLVASALAEVPPETVVSQLAPPPASPIVAADLIFLTSYAPHLAQPTAEWLRDHLASDNKVEQRTAGRDSKHIWEAKTLCQIYVWHFFGSPDWFETYVRYDNRSGSYESTLHPLLILDLWEEKRILPPAVCSELRTTIADYVVEHFGEWYTSVDARMVQFEFTDQYVEWLAKRLDNQYGIVDAWFEMRAAEFEERADEPPEEEIIDERTIIQTCVHDPGEAAELFLTLLDQSDAPEQNIASMPDDTLATMMGPVLPAWLAARVLLALHRSAPQRCTVIARQLGIDHDLLLAKLGVDEQPK